VDNEAVQDRNLSRAEHLKVGFRPWLNIQSAAQIWIGANNLPYRRAEVVTHTKWYSI
jgi:hypothetical protein